MATVPAAAEPIAAPTVDTGRAPGRPGGLKSALPIAVFMGPAALLLGFIVLYPVVTTVIDSFLNKDSSSFVGLDNYKNLFTTTETLVAIRNNAIWVIVFPFLVSFIGLVFAVLTERIRWATAFKIVVFAPMAVSLFATGVIWRIVFQTDPDRGLVNSAVATVADVFSPPGLYTGEQVRPGGALQAGQDKAMVSTSSVSPGGTIELGVGGIFPTAIPARAQHAQAPQSSSGGVVGIVYQDFAPGKTPGTFHEGEAGLPGMRVTLLSSDGSSAGHATTDNAGAFTFDGVSQGSYRVQLDDNNFKAGFQGVNWLGPQSLTPTSSLSERGQALLSVPLIDIAEIVAMLWIWSGFAMVVIGAGLAALNREVLEAARMDGASEWQTFRFVTLPLLMPVLIVVFVTMIINVLKIFDIVLAISPESSLSQANVIALQMYQTGFGSTAADHGLASAIAVFLFVLVVPVLIINVRRIRG